MNATNPTSRSRAMRSGSTSLGRGLTLLAMAAVGVPYWACGGSSPSAPTPVAVATPAPAAAAITASGNGALVLHPSIIPTFAIAMETPIRIRETAGGTADWNFVRLAFFRKGVEVERVEGGADMIRSAGASRITPNANVSYNLLFRFNSDDFDRLDITLGFTDINSNRQFTVLVPPNSFTDVNLSLSPLFRGLPLSGPPM